MNVGECVLLPLLRGIELEGMCNSKIDPTKARSFHVIKGSEQRKSEISVSQRPAARSSLAFSEGIQCTAEDSVS